MLSNREVIIQCFENVGILIDEDYMEDININDYDVDSFSFISLIVAIEEEFDIEIPDGFLYVDILKSLNGFVNMIEQLIEIKSNNPDMTVNI